MVRRASLFIGGTGGSDAASARSGLQVDSANDFATTNLAVSGNVNVGSGLFQTDDAKITVTVTGNSVITGNVVVGTPTAGSGSDGSINAQDVQINGVTVSQLGATQTYTQQQVFGTGSLTDAATIAWNLTGNQVARVKLAGNRILDNASNQIDGGMYTLQVEQDATGSRTLTFGTDYKFPGGTAPTLTTTGNAIDILTFHSNGTSMFGVSQLDFS